MRKRRGKTLKTNNFIDMPKSSFNNGSAKNQDKEPLAIRNSGSGFFNWKK
jgi:hypothetical protein